MVYNANVEVIDLKLKEPYILLAYTHMYIVLHMPLPLATVIGSDIEVSFLSLFLGVPCHYSNNYIHEEFTVVA